MLTNPIPTKKGKKKKKKICVCVPVVGTCGDTFGKRHRFVVTLFFLGTFCRSSLLFTLLCGFVSGS